MLLQKSRTEFPNWENVFGNFFYNDPESCAPVKRKNQGTYPAVNIKENDEAFTVEVAVPGKKKEDFKIDIQEKALSISAEAQELKEEKTDRFTRKEFNYASFKRLFTLPENVNADEISATYTDGILNVTIPKKEVKKAEIRTILIS